jgi:ATP-dependent DNA helicase RecQ
MTSSRDAALAILQKTYGYPSFRDQQAEIIEHVISGGNAFVLMPTGGGKSLCYQIPALCREGVGIVISPLIALMQDQVDALTQLGIKAAAINSSLSGVEVGRTIRQMRSGDLDLVYVAPERLLMEDFLALLSECTVALFAIDEAHCVSQWGHDFRPHYTQLSQLAERFPKVPRIALTATADGPTRKDIVERLHLGEGRTFVSGFDRPNIRYSILIKQEPRKQLLHFIKENHARENGIVYCLSRKATEETAEWLGAQGLRAFPYHAGMPAEERARNQTRFLREDNIIMVATIAFGMGIDKPDVRFVVHMTIPKNIEAYYQETGRAGRDGLPAEALMLYSLQDSTQLRKFIDESDAPDNQKRIEHRKLNSLLGLCETAACRRKILLEYFGDTGCSCGNCDNCQSPPETFDATIAAQKAISCCYRTGQRFGVAYLIEVLLGNVDDRMRQFGHDRLSTFGIGHEHEKREWQGIFRQLIALNLLAVDTSEFGSVVITPEGHRFLKEKLALRMKKLAKPEKSISKRRRDGPILGSTATYDPFRSRLLELSTERGETDASLASDKPPQGSWKDRPMGGKQTAALKGVPEQGSDEERKAQALFQALRNMRAGLARDQNVPSYVIFHDKVLREVAILRPESLAQMSLISGIGRAKLERYGDAVLQVVREHS